LKEGGVWTAYCQRGRQLQIMQSGPETHPASYFTGTGAHFPRVKAVVG